MPNDMLNPGSYFPPANTWSSRLPSPAVPAPAPLLPTPMPTALPSTLGGTLIEVPPHVVNIKEAPRTASTCSCPLTDTCIAESLALLLGSFKLLSRVVLELGQLSEWQDVLAARPLQAIELALSKFEVWMKKLFAPLLEGSCLKMEDLLLQEWLRPIQTQRIEGDICSRIRSRIGDAMINAVDTFPPMQHILHMLLVRYEFGSLSFRVVVEKLQNKRADPNVRLLLEAYRHLVQFSVKSDNAYKESLLDDLRCWVDSLERRSHYDETIAAMNERL